MQGDVVQSRPVVFTIGHSNVLMAAFLGLLKENSIEVVVDVRSAPYSRHVPHFNKDNLAEAVKAAGMEYVHLGRELGGTRSPGVPLDRIAGLPEFRAGIARLVRLGGQKRAAVMCGEENPAQCHRHSLIAPALAGLGVEVRHIRGDGRVQTEAELHREMTGGQAAFEFGEPD